VHLADSFFNLYLVNELDGNVWPCPQEWARRLLDCVPRVRGKKSVLPGLTDLATHYFNHLGLARTVPVVLGVLEADGLILKSGTSQGNEQLRRRFIQLRISLEPGPSGLSFVKRRIRRGNHH